MSLSIATWNINSVRLRIQQVEKFLNEYQPDVLCLQEIKCQNDQFPAKAFNKLGYEFHAVKGQKGYHGVATISKIPLVDISSTNYCNMGDSRHISVRFKAGGKDIQLHNFYVPAGGDEPDTDKNPKFAHKLNFLEEMRALRALDEKTHNVLVGDLNIAPHENDVWSHKQLLKIVSHTPVETDALAKIFDEGGWTDLIRNKISTDEKLFTWWSYRSRDWQQSNRGRRLDHIWGSPGLAAVQSDLQVVRETRNWEKPSDHIPVICTLDL
ncbi:Exodeoxyribonuclease III [hydrothermal vent metagenome]|uniref:Exodeoxyribonuclease III n=1 Tax=hydrothermal vent metagenome TaxID=652676 RepID=A0A3B1BJ70_9ZZZZ